MLKRIIPGLCAEVTNDNQQATVEASFMEIYNEKVFDLLDISNVRKSSLIMCLVPIRMDCHSLQFWMPVILML